MADKISDTDMIRRHAAKHAQVATAYRDRVATFAELSVISDAAWGEHIPLVDASNVAKAYRQARRALISRVRDLAQDHDDTSDDLGVVAGNYTAVESGSVDRVVDASRGST